MKKLVLAWRDPEKREWIPVGRLWLDGDQHYRFAYTKGANRAFETDSFMPFGQMNDLDKVYVSDDIFPIFKNRLLQKSRPEYSDYLSWLGFDREISALDELARTNGIRATDSLQIFEIPKEQDGKYCVYFFSHGISHLPANYIDRVNSLKEGEDLFLMKDIQNKVDRFALALRTGDPVEIVGYCPKFYAKDFNKLLGEGQTKEVKVSVVKLNLESPLQLRLLCKLECDWSKGFIPFEDEDFELIVKGIG